MKIYAPKEVFERWLHISFVDEEMFREVTENKKNLSPVFIIRPDLKPSRFITSAADSEFHDLSNSGTFQRCVPYDRKTIDERQALVDYLNSELKTYSPIKYENKRTRYKAQESLDLESLLNILDQDIFQNKDISSDSWHPKILKNVLKSVYMRPPYNRTSFDIYFLTNPYADECVERESTYEQNLGHFIKRYDEGSDRKMYKDQSKGEICLILLRIKPRTSDEQVWVPMIYLPDLDYLYRGGF
jgi:hypothetical protein